MKIVDVIICSPPYSSSVSADTDHEKRKERLIKSGHKKCGLFSDGKANKIVSGQMRYSSSQENIGNLSYNGCVVNGKS